MMYKVVADYNPQHRGAVLSPSQQSREWYISESVALRKIKEMVESYIYVSPNEHTTVWREKNGRWELQSGRVYGVIETIKPHNTIPDIDTAADRQRRLEAANES